MLSEKNIRRPNTVEPVETENRDAYQRLDVLPKVLTARSSCVKPLTGRLYLYGGRIRTSANHFLSILWETLTNLATALAGSVVFLPALIVRRALSILFANSLELVASLSLSLGRLALDVARMAISPAHRFTSAFNKQLLFPMIKRIKEDDAAALLAFGALASLVVAVLVVQQLPR
jgi:hypothetical protein